jgi:hypothetical protein
VDGSVPLSLERITCTTRAKQVRVQAKKKEALKERGTPADFVLFAQHEAAAQHFTFPTLARPKIQTGPQR